IEDEATSTGVDVRHEGATTTVTSLDARQDSGNIDKTLTMPHSSPLPRVKKLEKTVKTRQARRKARIVVSAAEEVYTTEKKVSTAKTVSTASASVSTDGASSAKDKGKAIMEEAETIQTKTKLQLEQERFSYEVTG
ncbi:hypothetical protein Tco_1339784, partial [Tanacetum coccineum]